MELLINRILWSTIDTKWDEEARLERLHQGYFKGRKKKKKKKNPIANKKKKGEEGLDFCERT